MYKTPKVAMRFACPLGSHKRLYILRFGCATKRWCVNTRCPCSLWTEIFCILCSNTVDVSSFIFYSPWMKVSMRNWRKTLRDTEKAGKGWEGYDSVVPNRGCTLKSHGSFENSQHTDCTPGQLKSLWLWPSHRYVLKLPTWFRSAVKVGSTSATDSRLQ